jgi:hypothetical protein
MATRSRIGVELEDGTVKSVYCHWDGYVSNNGKTLLECYDRVKTLALVELGDLSSLGEQVEPNGPHSFESPQGGVTVAYHRDRGEDLTFHIDNSVEDFFKSDYEEYGYVIGLDGRWLVAWFGKSPLDLEREVKHEIQ